MTASSVGNGLGVCEFVRTELVCLRKILLVLLLPIVRLQVTEVLPENIWCDSTHHGPVGGGVTDVNPTT